MSEGVVRVLNVTEGKLKGASMLSSVVYVAVVIRCFFAVRSHVPWLDILVSLQLLVVLPTILSEMVVVGLRWVYGYAKGNCGAKEWTFVDGVSAMGSAVAGIASVLSLLLLPMFDLQFVFTRLGLYMMAVTVAILLTTWWLLRLAWRDYCGWRAYVVDEEMPVDFQEYVALMCLHMAMDAK